jgi:CHAT domain-containing protein
VLLVLAAVRVCPNAQAWRGPQLRLDTNSSPPLVEIRQQNTKTTSLTVGEHLQCQIAGDEIQVFTLAVRQNQFAQVAFEWQGFDLDVQVFKPSGKQLAGADVQVRGSGSLPLVLLADEDGDYKLIMRPVEKAKIEERYRLTLEVVRPPSPADLQRLEAMKLLVEGRQEKNSRKLQQALQLWNDLRDATASVYTLRALGSLFLQAKPTSNSANSNEQPLGVAKEYYRQAIEISGNGDQRRFGYTLLEIGADYQRLISPMDALTYFDQASQVFHNNADQPGEGAALYSMGFAWLLTKTKLKEEALSRFELALIVYRNQHDRLNEARTLNAMGGVYGVLADQNSARGYYQQAAAIFHELNDRRRETIANNNIAVASDDLGDWQEAGDKYRENLRTYESLLSKQDSRICQDKPAGDDVRICGSMAVTLGNLAELHNSLGEPLTALELLQQSLFIRQALNEPRGLGETLSRIAYAHLLNNEPTETLKYCDQALPFSERSNDLSKQVSILTFKGMAHTALGNPDEALKYYEEAEKKETNDERAKGILFDQKGRAYAAKKDLAQAIENYKKALNSCHTSKDEDWETRTLYDLADAERNRGNIAQAHEYIETAVRVVESRRTLLRSQNLRLAYFANKEDLYKLDVDLKMQLGKTADSARYTAAALEVSEQARARLLLDLLREQGVERALAARNSEGARFAALLHPQRISSSEIQAQLDANTLLLEYSLGEVRSYVWVIAGDFIKAFELPARKEIDSRANKLTLAVTERNRVVTNETAAQYQSRRDRADADYRQAAAELSQMIVAPCASLLGNKGLVIVADGALQMVSFGALPTPGSTAPPDASTNNPRKETLLIANGHLLSDDHEIVYEPSASVLAVQRADVANRKPAPHAVAILADPVYDKNDTRARSSLAASSGGSPSKESPRPLLELTRALDDVGIPRFPRLRESGKEAESIRNAAPKGESLVARDFAASRAMATSPDLSQYRVVHFAAHSIVDYNRPELSGIVLSMVDEKGQPEDGYLQLRDIYKLNLPADLVVLSACQTGIGKEIKGEGLIALTRGFMYAGAARVIATLWKVDDAATAELMAEFYKQMYRDGRTPAAALRGAQKKLSQQPGRRSPYYWAGFVLQGEWR